MNKGEKHSTASSEVAFRQHILPLFRGIRLSEGRNPDGSLVNYAASPTRLRSLLTGVRHNTVISTGETPRETIKGLIYAENDALKGRR